MHRLFRSVDRNIESGSALPQVFNSFSEMDINLFKGELVMWAGPPGAGKSAAAINYAVKAKVPSLYISCDMTRSLVTHRVGAILTDKTVNDVRDDMSTEVGRQKYRDILYAVDHLYMAYPSRPDAEGIANKVMAFQEIYGLPPELLIIDNLMNLTSGAKDEWTGLRDLAQLFHYIATELSICVLVLHHINLGGLDLWYPAPLNFIKGQITELPASVLTFCSRPGELLISPVKNRHGKKDSSGKTFVTLAYDEERQIITDKMVEAVAVNVWQEETEVVPDWFSKAFKD